MLFNKHLLSTFQAFVLGIRKNKCGPNSISCPQGTCCVRTERDKQMIKITWEKFTCTTHMLVNSLFSLKKKKNTFFQEAFPECSPPKISPLTFPRCLSVLPLWFFCLLNYDTLHYHYVHTLFSLVI